MAEYAISVYCFYALFFHILRRFRSPELETHGARYCCTQGFLWPLLRVAFYMTHGPDRIARTTSSQRLQIQNLPTVVLQTGNTTRQRWLLYLLQKTVFLLQSFEICRNVFK